MQYIAARRAQHDVVELFNRLQTAFVLQVVLIGISALLTKRTRGGYHVLVADSGEDIFRSQAVTRHHIRLHPDTQRIGVT